MVNSFQGTRKTSINSGIDRAMNVALQCVDHNPHVLAFNGTMVTDNDASSSDGCMSEQWLATPFKQFRFTCLDRQFKLWKPAKGDTTSYIHALMHTAAQDYRLS